MDMPPPRRLAASLQGLAGTVLTLLQVRLELLSVEAQEEVLRVVGFVLFGTLAVVGARRTACGSRAFGRLVRAGAGARLVGSR